MLPHLAHLLRRAADTLDPPEPHRSEPNGGWPRLVRLDSPVTLPVEGPGVVRYDGQRMVWVARRPAPNPSPARPIPGWRAPRRSP